jgi:hypothetical protein
VSRILIKDKWLITHDPYTISFGGVLYLAIPSFSYDTFFSLEFPQLMIRENQLKLIIFEPSEEVILTWIN